MTTLAEDLAVLAAPTPGAARLATPGLRQDRAELPDFDGERGELTVHGAASVHDWQEVLKIALPPGFDPADYALVGNPRVTSHTVLVDGEWTNVQAWWKIAFARIDVLAADQRDEDAERLHDELTRWKLPKRRTALDGRAPFVVNLADWQMGQLDDGGSGHTVARLKAIYAGIADRVRALRRLGVPLGTCVVAGLGDLVEGCDGFYPMQTFSVDLDRRAQVNVVRRLIVKLLKLLVEIGFEEVVVVAVGGNHGENRRDGKSFTTLADNDDLAAFDAAYDVISETPHADRFRWKIPTDELVNTLEVGGRVLGWTHGHLARVPGATPQKKLWTWWEKQCMGRRDVAAAELLVTAHYHHFSAVEDEGRFHLQTPAVCGTSAWWNGMTGQGSVPGLLTFVVDPDGARPFTQLEIITP